MKSIHGAAIVVLALGLRMIWPLSDPPERLSWSNGEITDPPAIVHAARNVVLFGEWERDESKDLVFFPLLNVITAGAFSLFGANRLVIQVLSALFGAGAVAAIAWALRRAGTASPLGVVFVAVSFWIVMFSRIPMAENLVLLLLAVSAGFALGRTNRDFWAAGFFAGVAAFFGKLHAGAFLPALVLFLLARRSFRVIPPVGGGFGLALILWLALIFAPRHEAVLDQFARSGELYGESTVFRSPIDLLLAPLRAIRFSWLHLRFMAPLLLGGWFALTTLGQPSVFRRRVENGSALFALWVLSAWLALSVLPYVAPRYFLLAAIPLAVCSAFQIEEWRAGLAPSLASLRKWQRLLVYAWLVFVCFAVIGATGHWISWMDERIFPVSPKASAAFVGATQRWADASATFEGCATLAVLFASIAFAILIPITRRRPPILSAHPRIAALTVGVLLGLDLLQFVDWAAHRTYAVEQAKKSFDAIIGPDAIVSGTFASTLVLGSKRVAVPLFGDPRSGYLEDENATHLAIGEPGDVGNLENTLPEVSGLLAPVQSWPVPTRHLRKISVFRIQWPDSSSIARHYEPTPFEKAVDLKSAGEYAAAFAQLEAFRASGTEVADVYSLQAECRHQLGDLPGARALLEKALHLRPASPQDLFNLANLLYREGDRQGAHELWVQGFRFDPNDLDLAQAILLPVEGP